jgi:hypothetical protein
MLARTTWGLSRSVPAPVTSTASTSAASALRSSAPRLPGFSRPSATNQRPSVAPGRSSRVWLGRLDQRQDAVGVLAQAHLLERGSDSAQRSTPRPARRGAARASGECSAAQVGEDDHGQPPADGAVDLARALDERHAGGVARAALAQAHQALHARVGGAVDPAGGRHHARMLPPAGRLRHAPLDLRRRPPGRSPTPTCARRRPLRCSARPTPVACAYAPGTCPAPSTSTSRRDLSGPIGRHGGRHPLPDPDAPGAALGAPASVAGRHVVAYDAGDGMVAGGSGGCCAGWVTTRSRCSTAASRPGSPRAVARDRRCPRRRRRASCRGRAGHGRRSRLAARAARRPDRRGGRRPRAERYRGEVEPLDPRAGHVPGASTCRTPTTSRGAASARSRSWRRATRRSRSPDRRRLLRLGRLGRARPHGARGRGVRGARSTRARGPTG